MKDSRFYIFRGPKKKTSNDNTGDEAVPKDIHFARVDESVTHIPPNTFKDCGDLESVDFSNGIVGIGDLAFCRCRMLREVIIPPSASNTLGSIGIQAFMDCRRLVQVKLPQQSALQVISPGAFQLCFELKEIEIPASVRIIGNFAFVWCSKLSKVNLHEGLVSIGEGAFRKCSGLSQVLIPQSTREIGDFAFAECYHLISVELSPHGLQYLGHAAFAECSLLTNVSLPSSLDLTGMDSFYQCTKLVDACYTSERLCDRYARSSPIHKLCYEQGYYSTQICMERLQEAFGEVVVDNSSLWVDECGLTPFHILAMSTRPNSYLFQSLLQASPSTELLCSRDKWGKTPLQYLSKSHHRAANSLIQMVLQQTIVPRIQWLGLSQWRRELWTAIDGLTEEDVGKRTEQVCQLEHRLAILERLESTSLLELAIWKNSLQNHSECQAENDRLVFDMEKNNRLRDGCRFSCGSETIITFVLSWMDSRTDGANEDVD